MPEGGATLAVLDSVPVAFDATVAVTVKVALAPGASARRTTLRLPLPLRRTRGAGDATCQR